MPAPRTSMHCATRLLPALALTLLASGMAAGVAIAATTPTTPATPATPAPSNKPTSPTATAQPGSITIGIASVTYHASAGDTLISIALRYTDKASNWVTLGKLNGIDKDSAIPIGSAILIPGELLGDVPARATVVVLTGTVAATTAQGGTDRLALGATVAEGTRLETGHNSFITLELADHSRISVPSNARVKIAKLRTARYLNSPRTEVLLLRGQVESRVAPLAASRGRYEVRTPLSVAGVRGTHFRVGYVGIGASTKIATETLEGKVAVATASQARAPDGLILAAGQGNLTDSRQAGPALDLLPAPRLLPADGRVSSTVFAPTRIALASVAGARAYHIQIASDAQAQNLLAESRAPLPVLTVDGIADGPYFVRLSAIDRFGIEGRAGIEPITLRRDANLRNGGTLPGPSGAPGAPAVASSDERSVSFRWTPVAGQSMRLQLARDSDFTYLLSSRTSSNGEARLPRPQFGTYYARVETLDAQGNPRVSSMAQPFIVTDQWVIHDGAPIAVRQSRAQDGR